MNILGLGDLELLAILVIMLVVLGPRGMARWAYTVGQYTAKMRRMWSEAMLLLQREFKDAGIDVNLPKEVPTRRTLNKQVNKALSSVTRPVQDTLDEVNTELKQIKAATSLADQNGSKVEQETPPSSTDQSPNFGTWSNPEQKDE
jgi:Sec-independent protein translocase protein TatA